MFKLLLLIFLAASTDAAVEFTYSTFYDMYDFINVTEVKIPRCNTACMIYVSTMGHGFAENPTDLDPYAENLIIVDSHSPDRNISVANAAELYIGTSLEKQALRFQGADVSIVNLNDENTSAWPIVIYVLDDERAKALSYHIYDAVNMKDVDIDPNSINAVMSAMAFSITGQRYGAPNSVNIRLAGVENARSDTPDSCIVAYQTEETGSTFEGFTFQMPVPMVTVVTGRRNTFKMSAMWDFIEVRDLKTNGFFVSPGYSACSIKAGRQNFRSNFYDTTDSYMLNSGSLTQYDVTLDIFPNLDKDHSLTIQDVTNQGKPNYVVGTTAVTQLKFKATDYILISFKKMTGSQGFLMRYTDTPLTTTTIPTSTSPVTVPSTTVLPSTTSSRIITTTSDAITRTMSTASILTALLLLL